MKSSTAPIKGHVILHRADTQEWLCFSHPSLIVVASKPDEVLPALEKTEDLVNSQGWYAAGFISYEAGSAFDSALSTRTLDEFPMVWFGLYPGFKSCRLRKPDFDAYSMAEPVPAISHEDYDSAIERIKHYIESGDTYQVNYTIRLRASFQGNPYHLFLAMVKAQSAGYAAWLDTGRYAICSASPELFFRLSGNRLTCKPMKGTVHRGRTLREDKELADWLHRSEKNRAENLMIVDMIRNDLGRVAAAGSVEVAQLFEVERHQTLWQMTSTITAQCAKSFTDIVSALFPCASITGAPKVRTTQIISELEPEPRGLYTGSIGFLAPHRTAQFNVAIRTAVLDRNTSQVEYGSGGGIVWDSSCRDEYREALLKARVLTEQRPEFSLLETILWTRDQSYFLLDRHLQRLADSAEYFNFPASVEMIEAQLMERARSFSSDAMRIRLLVDADGSTVIQADPLNGKHTNPPLRLALALNPVDSADIFLYHKTTYRKVYDEARQACVGCDDVLLWNERGEITESSIANVVVRIDGGLFTPPVDSGLLEGTYRSWMLESGMVHERVIKISDLNRCSNIYLINSVRKMQEAVLRTP